MLEIILDTETTGLSVQEGHRIVEIGCIEIDNFTLTGNKFHCYLNPERKISKQAQEIHGYSDIFLADKKKFKDVANEFLHFIKDKKLVIHNADFDISHLNNELSLIGKDKIEKNNVIDTLDIARDKFPGSGISLDALCKRYRIDNSKRVKHNALIDCELLYKVYINLIDQKEPTLNFNIRVENDNLQNQKLNKSYFKKIISPSQEELKLHKEYLKNNLKKNYF